MQKCKDPSAFAARSSDSQEAESADLAEGTRTLLLPFSRGIEGLQSPL